MNRYSFVELSARERAEELLDKGTFRELLDPFARMYSPHLEEQGIVPQNDDGVVIALGEMNGEAAVVISIEGAFQGGAIGEVSGAKIAGALELTLSDHKQGLHRRPVVILDSGGVRLQEANYGLLAIAEIQAAVVELRQYTPVVGVIPGKVGSFGGMSITAGLFSDLVMTPEGRLGLNGPEVIEQEAGIQELDAANRPRIWQMIGGAQRTASHLADVFVDDDVDQIKLTVDQCFTERRKSLRVEQISHYENMLEKAALETTLTPKRFRELAGENFQNEKQVQKTPEAESRGQRWFQALTSAKMSAESAGAATVWSADAMLGEEYARFLTVGPNRNHRFLRVRNGEVGLEEGWGLARAIEQAVQADAQQSKKRAIIAIVDVPSQAYGYREELLGLHQSCAAAVNAYASARLAGHPVIAFLVGKAISGAFLSHGLQANQLLALDDEQVNVHVMSKESAARVTRRTMGELEEITKKIPGMAYDIHSFHELGALHQLISNIDADNPNPQDIGEILSILENAVAEVRANTSKTLEHRLHSERAKHGRKMSMQVRVELEKLW